MSRAESDEGLGQACVVRDQGVTNSWVGIVAGHGRFMQQGRAGWRTRSSATRSSISDGLCARSPAGQGSEVVLGCEILNRMTEFDRPVVISYRQVRILSVGPRAGQ